MTARLTIPLRRVRAVVVALLLALAGLGAAPAAAIAATPADTPPAYLRLAHLSPDTPTVDVYVDSAADPSRSFVVPGVGYGAVSDYKPLPPDSYVISMRPAGAPASSPPVISASVDAKPGAAYTVAGTGRSANLGLSVLNDKLDAPPAGKASVRVINAALSTPSADVGPVNGPVWAKGVAFGTETNYVDCPLGNWDLKVTAGDTAKNVPLTLEQNSSYTVLLVDKGNGLEPQVKRDSTGVGTVPTGGVNTGMGGAAGPSRLLLGGAAGLALLVAALTVVVAVRRQVGGR
jgi:Domain of unknown function (DUF4397)